MGVKIQEQSPLSPTKRALLKLEEMQARLEGFERSGREPIAVVGIGCRFPGGANHPIRFWQNLVDGVDAIGEIPSERWDVDTYYDPEPGVAGKIVSRWGGFLEAIDEFDPAFFGISPREAVAMDPQQRLLLEVVWQALENAGQAPDRLSKSRTGVFIGMCKTDYMLVQVKQGNPALFDTYYASGNAHSIGSGRISYLLGLQGPSITVDTACSSSLVALHLACQSLRLGECDMALTGGVNVILSPENAIALSKSSMLSPQGRCRTFDASADGFVPGEGCGIVVLKRVSKAEADGNRILALVRGTAANQDGPSSGLTAPNGPAQVAVIREALANAGLEPNRVSYVETHGTATSLGDPIEVQAIGEALCRDRSREERLIIGSVKTNIGHLEAASGIASFIKAVLALQHHQIPSHLHLRQPNPFIEWENLPIEVPKQTVPWPRGTHPRVAGVSSFGFSGTNVHVVLEEAPETGPKHAETDRPIHLFTLSARSREALNSLCGNYQTHLDSAPPEPIADICFTAGAGRAHFNHRLAALVASVAELKERLAMVGGEQTGAGLSFRETDPADPPRIAFLFTGQGAQYSQMGRRLFESQPTFRRAMERCDAIFRPLIGESLLDLLYAGVAPDPEREERIHQTGIAQPALFAIGYALAELWRSWGIQPQAVMGHSVGEYIAACVAGVFSLEDGLALVADRGRLMQSLPSGGAMVSVFANSERLAGLIAPDSDKLTIAAFNGPEHTVISGDADAIRSLLSRLEQVRIRFQSLKVSHAFHSSLMDPILDEFEKCAQRVTYAAPRLQLVSNVSGTLARGGAVGQADYWRRHIREPVQFAASIQTLYDQGYRLFLEIGPHPVLLGLGAQCLPAGKGIWLPSLRRGADDWKQLLTSLGSLYTYGADVNLAGFDRDYPRCRVALPTYPFERKRYWIEEAVPAPGGPVAQAGESARLVHPLLGRQLQTPLQDRLFETRLDCAALPFLADHTVHGLIVFPATGYLEMATAAAGEYFAGRPGIVRDLTILDAITLSREKVLTAQLVVHPGGDGEASFQLFSMAGEGAESKWRLHCTGKISIFEGSPPGADETESFETIRARCDREISIEAFYTALGRRGLIFGTMFRAVEQLWRREGEAIGKIRFGGSVMADLAPFQCHPALLDACLQVAAAAVTDLEEEAADSNLYMPIGLDRFTVFRKLPSQVISHARIDVSRLSNRETLTGHIDIRDESGRPVARLEGMHFKRIAPETLYRNLTGQSEEWLYQIEWRRQDWGSDEEQTGPTHLLDTTEIGRRLAPGVAELGRGFGAEVYESLNPDLDRLCTAYIASGLRELGWSFDRNAPISSQSLADRLCVAPRHYRLLDRFLGILGDDGVVIAEGGEWRPAGLPNMPDPQILLPSLMERYAGQTAELILTQRCGSRMAALLRGEADPLELLFPGGNLEIAAGIYRTSPLAVTYNTVAQGAVTAAIESCPLEKRIRILEIGAGTGGTASHVLPALPPDRTEYFFTDLGPSFLEKAADAFVDFPFVSYRTLDIDKDPEDQGFTPGRFDVVLAANVLHATANLGATLERVRRLLAPGGMLVILEGVVPQRWFDLTFGFTEGWWRFSDTHRRSFSPMIGRSQWINLLAETGFEGITVLPPAEVRGALADNAVILARRPEADAVISGHSVAEWLILIDRGGVGEVLAQRLRASGETCRIVRQGDATGTAHVDPMMVDPRTPGDFHRLLQTVCDGDRHALKGIVFLWTLDGPAESGFDENWPENSQDPGCRALLYLVQAITSRSDAQRPRLWVATRGSQPVGEAPIADPPIHAPVWGLGRVIALEHPDLRCVLVDLPPEGEGGDAQLLLAEIGAPDREDQVAFRAGARHVARLVRTKLAGRSDATDSRTADKPVRLEIATPGSLDGIELRPAERRAPGPDEAEIRVHATGLNFRDVLNVLGERRDPQPLGGECSGIVVRVGASVKDFRIGDPVIAIVEGGFATYVTTRCDFLVHKPASVGFEQAATFPLAFLTAHYALNHIGRLKRGERVLIHAAAGGVGMAAVQLALEIGAEIFATAGSPQKRAFLKSVGVHHVMDSRTLSFSDRIRELTRGEGVHVVLNSLTGESIARSLSCLAAGGRFLEIGKADIWKREKVDRVNPDAAYHVIDLAEKLVNRPDTLKPIFYELSERFARGEIKPLPMSGFPLQKAPEAFRFMAQSKHIGKVIVTQPGASGLEAMRAAGSGETGVRLRPESTYLVTGGLAGIGLRVAEWLVEKGAGHIVLIARSDPDNAALEAIGGMQQKGAKILALKADVADEKGLNRAFEQMGAVFPPLRGLFHCAGVLDDGVLDQQNWERFDRVMAPKVKGVWNLHLLTRNLPMEWFVLFSSVASVFGSAGQSNHAAANAFMDAMASYRSGLGLPATSINWGAWSGVGAAVKHGVDRRLDTKGVGLIAPEAGIRMLERILTAAPVQVIVTPVDWFKFLERKDSTPIPPIYRDMAADRRGRVAAPAASGDPAGASGAAAQDEFMKRLEQAPPNRRRAILLEKVESCTLRILGIHNPGEMNPRQPLSELGLDSLMAVELRNVLGTALKRSLPTTLLFDYPSIEALVDYLAQEVLGFNDVDQRPAAGSVPAGSSSADLLSAIESLSDEEVERMIGNQTGENPQ